ncbi:MAG: hypothetical protein ACYC8V_04005 [Caulobacteraceae bacterium]
MRLRRTRNLGDGQAAFWRNGRPLSALGESLLLVTAIAMAVTFLASDRIARSHGGPAAARTHATAPGWSNPDRSLIAGDNPA